MWSWTRYCSFSTVSITAVMLVKLGMKWSHRRLRSCLVVLETESWPLPLLSNMLTPCCRFPISPRSSWSLPHIHHPAIRAFKHPTFMTLDLTQWPPPTPVFAVPSSTGWWQHPSTTSCFLIVHSEIPRSDCFSGTHFRAAVNSFTQHH